MAGVGDDVDDVRAVFEFAELFDGEKTHAGEIRFLAEDAGIACCGYGTTDNNPCAWLSRFA